MPPIADTRYPILLVHGLFGFDSIGPLIIFNGVAKALKDAGAQAFTVSMSAVHDNETRGEQLLQQIEEVCRQTGARKVNLLAHSQGPLAARYAAAVRPERVASVTSISGVNHGSELADALRDAYTPGAMSEQVAASLMTSFGALLSLLSGKPEHPQDALAALHGLTTEGVAAFNRRYPQGLPRTWGGHGDAQVNGVRYYSWSGTIQGNLLDEGANAFDPLHLLCRALAVYFKRERNQNDGWVGRFSTHLGQVIRSDYPMDHLDTVNLSNGIVRPGVDPLRLYVEHAARLKQAGL